MRSAHERSAAVGGKESRLRAAVCTGTLRRPRQVVNEPDPGPLLCVAAPPMMGRFSAQVGVGCTDTGCRHRFGHTGHRRHEIVHHYPPWDIAQRQSASRESAPHVGRPSAQEMRQLTATRSSLTSTLPPKGHLAHIAKQCSRKLNDRTPPRPARSRPQMGTPPSRPEPHSSLVGWPGPARPLLARSLSRPGGAGGPRRGFRFDQGQHESRSRRDSARAATRGKCCPDSHWCLVRLVAIVGSDWALDYRSTESSAARL